MHASANTLLVFIDGLGLGEPNPAFNPLYRGQSPFLVELLEAAVPLDAGLGVPGTPQSATGQAVLFTGENAAAHMERHVEGIPGPRLKAFVREHNVYRKLQDKGHRCTFANAYYMADLEQLMRYRRHSVSTVAALDAFGTVRMKDRMEKNRAVHQDLTRELLRKRGYEGPLIAPEEAAEHLAAVAADYSYTVFEYFQTDLMAHRGTPEDMARILGHLDAFFRRLVQCWAPHGRLVLVSDHGNLEDDRIRTHTLNPVPFLCLGRQAEAWPAMSSLLDYVPALLGLYARL